MGRKKIAVASVAIIFMLLMSFAYGGRFSAVRKIIKSDEFAEVAELIYKKSRDIVDSVKIKFPVNSSKEAVKNIVRSGVSATTVAVSAANANLSQRPSPTAEILVRSNVDDPYVRIMNITDKYYQGIPVSPGSYDLEVSKEGYRTSRFWVNIDSSNIKGSQVMLDVNLNPIGVVDCDNDVELSAALPTTIDGSQVLQVKTRYKNEYFSNLYLSFSKNADRNNFARVISSKSHDDYAEFLIAQPWILSKKDVKLNSELEIDPSKFILNRMTFEQIDDDVVMVHQAFLPPGSFPIFTKNSMCEMYERI
jgi:hypothetical protein